MKVVPQLLYQHEKVKKIMIDGLSSIVHKSIDTIDTETDHYVATHVISIVLKGKLKVQTYYEGEQFLASQNQVVFIPKGRYMISDIIPENDAFEAVFFFIEDDLINSFLENKEDLENADDFRYVLKYARELKIFTETILELYKNESNNYKEITKLKLLELLYLFYNTDQRNNFLKILKSLQKTTKRNIKEIMEANFDKPLLVEDYAFLTGRSVSSFRRDFKRYFGASPKEWLANKRLEKAKILLSTTDLNINQVALEIGFDNDSHFIYQFRKRYGETPKQFSIRERMIKLV